MHNAAATFYKESTQFNGVNKTNIISTSKIIVGVSGRFAHFTQNRVCSLCNISCVKFDMLVWSKFNKIES